jgi:chromosome segregation protein
MRFKKLEISGFKSFFDKTTFLIEEGLTGIVGPNGCGKSNIVESLRWCMGETSAKSMRGSGMEDIIFSGTSNRPAKNISEVSVSIENPEKDGPAQYNDLDEIIVSRRIERDKGSKYFMNGKEVRARDAQTFFADLSTGAHSPSLISQGKIGMLVTSKPSERRSVLEEAAGISGIHARRQEAELRLNAAENNLKRADELKKQQEKQLENLKKQAEEATRYKEISKEIKSIEAGLYFLKLSEIENEKRKIVDKLSEQDDEISAIKIDLNHNNTLLDEENNRLAPLRDRKMESLAKVQKLNLDMVSLNEEETRIKNLQIKLQKSQETLDSDLEREKSISLDATLNQKRILEERDKLIETEKSFIEIAQKSEDNLFLSKKELSSQRKKFDDSFKEMKNFLNSEVQLKLFEELKRKMENIKEQVNLNKFDNIKEYISNIQEILSYEIDKIKNIDSKDFINSFKTFTDETTALQEKYASVFGKNETIKSDSIKREERIKNIDIELENWKNLKINSDKMTAELNERKNKIKLEIIENQKNPERIATNKGQNIQNLENTKKRAEELEVELNKAEEKYNSINQNLTNIQEKYSSLRENKARNEATIEGIEKRKKDLIFSAKNDLKIDNENNLLSVSNLNNVAENNLPSIEKQQEDLEKIKKTRDSLGSVNLRADEETKKYKDEIQKMQDDRADLYTAIVKLKTSIDELNQKGREKLLDAFTKVNRKFNEVYTKLFSGGNAKLELVDSDDPLEAGLEMLVSPPGKRLQSITLLSGGEQALTALSLIFAVFLVNPSPICVLDEVDAPLDDSNVTRFCSLLDELVKITKTKFIIISHHALTMSRMHRLYGVTMPEKGVSQLVAVDLQKAEGLVA